MWEGDSHAVDLTYYKKALATSALNFHSSSGGAIHERSRGARAAASSSNANKLFKNRPAGAKRTNLLKSSKSREWQKKSTAALPIAKWVVPLFKIILIYHPPLCGLRLWWQLQSLPHIATPMGRKKAPHAADEHSNPSLLGATKVSRRCGCMLSPSHSPLSLPPSERQPMHCTYQVYENAGRCVRFMPI